MNVRLRFKDPLAPVRYVRGRDLAPHPLNWRTHPPSQLDALRGLLAEVGFCDALKGYEGPDGRIVLIDGHARAEVLPDQEVPVLVLDLTDAEARLLLASFDPIGALAEADAAKLDELLRGVEPAGPALRQLLADLAADSAVPPADAGPSAEVGAGPERFRILVEFPTEAEQAEWLERLTAEGLSVRSLIG